MFGHKRKGMAAAGSKAPAFQLTGLDGEPHSLEQILQRGPALLMFYKISCPVCQLTTPYLQRLAAGGSLQVVGISQDDAGATRAFNQRFGVTFPTLVDPESQDYPASNAFGISSVPALFVLESDGAISKSFSGFSKGDLEALGERAGIQIFRPAENVPEWKAG